MTYSNQPSSHFFADTSPHTCQHNRISRSTIMIYTKGLQIVAVHAIPGNEKESKILQL